MPWASRSYNCGTTSQIAGTRGRPGDLERLPLVLHEAARTLKHSERRVAFVQSFIGSCLVDDMGVKPARYLNLGAGSEKGARFLAAALMGAHVF